MGQRMLGSCIWGLQQESRETGTQRGAVPRVWGAEAHFGGSTEKSSHVDSMRCLS